MVLTRREFLKYCGLSAAALGLGTSIYPQIASVSQPIVSFKFAFISDIHFGLDVKKENGEKLYPELWFKEAQAGIETKGVDFIIIGGDLIEKSNTLEQFDKYDAAKTTQLPCYIAPGNHDIGSFPKTINQASIATWKKRGYTSGNPNEYYGFVHKDTAIYMMNTSLHKSADLMLQQKFDVQIADMDAFFSQNADILYKIIVGHIPVYIENREEEDCEFNIEKTARDKILNVMEKHQIRYFFAGHRHVDEVVQDKGLVIFTNTAISFQLGDSSKRGYYIYTVTDKGIKRDFYPLEENKEVEANRYKG